MIFRPAGRPHKLWTVPFLLVHAESLSQSASVDESEALIQSSFLPAPRNNRKEMTVTVSSSINFTNQKLMSPSRVLRGGSYSRGGSSYHGGSSSGWRNNRNHNHNRSNNRNGGMSRMGRMFAGITAAAIGLALLAMFFPAMGAACCGCLPCLAGLCCGAGLAAAASNNNKPNSGDFSSGGTSNQGSNYYAHEPYNNTAPFRSHQPPSTSYQQFQPIGSFQQQQKLPGDFDNYLQKAKKEVEGNPSSAVMRNTQHETPFSGLYSTSFVDPESQVTHHTKLELHFTPDFQGRGYKISGQGDDIDGMTVIEDGHANFDGAAWWRERTISGDVGLQVMSRGRFDFQKHTFQGYWLANSMVTGPYITFAATNSTTKQNQPYVTAEPLGNEAMNSTPIVVSAVPVTRPSTSTSTVVVAGTPVPAATATTASVGSSSLPPPLAAPIIVSGHAL